MAVVINKSYLAQVFLRVWSLKAISEFKKVTQYSICSDKKAPSLNVDHWRRVVYLSLDIDPRGRMVLIIV